MDTNYKYDDFQFEETGDLINTGLFSIELVDPHDYDLKEPHGSELRVYLNEIGKKIRDVLKKPS